MTTQTKTKTKLDDEISSVWPPIAHIIRKSDTVMKALCGAKLMGIDLPDATKVCDKCVKIAKEELGL